MDKQYSVIETTGAFTPENPPEDGDTVWAISTRGRAYRHYFDAKRDNFELSCLRLFPTCKLAEASAKSYQTAAARGAKLVGYLQSRMYDCCASHPPEVYAKREGFESAIAGIQSILKEEVTG